MAEIQLSVCLRRALGMQDPLIAAHALRRGRLSRITMFNNQIEMVAASLLREPYADDIELTISNAKKTPYDKWFKR